MLDHSSFIATICERPFDDFARLVYAEALEEDGDGQRAEFIRVQLQIAEQLDLARRLRASPENDRLQDALEAREKELLGTGVGDGYVPSDEWLVIDGLLGPRLDGKQANKDGGRLVYAVRVVGGESCRSCKGTGRLEFYDHHVECDFCFGAGTEVQKLTAVVRRGMVEEVRLTAAQLVGGPCRRCGGQGNTAVHSDGEGHVIGRNDCPACNGSGRAEGIAAVLFAACPVLHVKLVDKRPARPPTGAPDAQWLGYANSSVVRGVDLANVLPMTLWERLPEKRPNNSWWRTYVAVNVAEEALSRAAVDFGRAEAGLPPLAWPPLPEPRGIAGLREAATNAESLR